MHKLHHYHIYDVINTSLPWAGRVWRGRVINTCPRSPSLCSAVPLFGRPFDRADTNDLISTSPAPAAGWGRRHAWLILLLAQNPPFPTTGGGRSTKVGGGGAPKMSGGGAGAAG